MRSTLLAYIEQVRHELEVKCVDLNRYRGKQGTKDFSVEKRFIKEKAVSLIVQVASHDWPAQWSNLLDLLVQIAGQGVRHFRKHAVAFKALTSRVAFMHRKPNLSWSSLPCEI